MTKIGLINFNVTNKIWISLQNPFEQNELNLNSILDSNVPLKRDKKYKLKFKTH